MYNQEIAQKAAEKFAVGVGLQVDALFASSDGELFFSKEDAETNIATKNLVDKAITPYYRDNETRRLAEQFKDLQKIMVATDHLKLCKAKRKQPIYLEYVAYAEAMGMESIPEQLFLFVQSKVFGTRALVTIGLKDQIYMYKRGIVDAYFLRQYPQGKVWQVGDHLVLTCPTHTELMSGTYQDIFPSILSPAKVAHKA